MTHRVAVFGLLRWIDPARLLGPGHWTIEGKNAHTTLLTHEAADLDARLRGVGIGGSPITMTADPRIPRTAVRAARTTDARRRRETTPGFTRTGVRLDEEGRWSLTPEALALTLAERMVGRTVIDAGCGAGGNAIAFARAGCNVVAIECDSSRIACARHNANVYGVGKQILFVHGEAGAVIAGMAADARRQSQRDTVLFADPPWGTEWPRDRVLRADVPLLDEVLRWGTENRDWISEVHVKLPPSFDVSDVENATAEAWYGRARGDERRVKFVTVRVRFDEKNVDDR